MVGKLTEKQQEIIGHKKCPQCSGIMNIKEAALNRQTQRVKKTAHCPECGAWYDIYDKQALTPKGE